MRILLAVVVLFLGLCCSFSEAQTLEDRGMVQIGASFSIGGMAGLTSFANYTDPTTGQKIFFWGGSGGLYRLTGSPDNVASAQQIYTSDVAAITLAPSKNYGFICRDRNVYRFSLTNPSGTKENLGNYNSWCYQCGTVSDCAYLSSSDAIYVASGAPVLFSGVTGSASNVKITDNFFSADLAYIYYDAYYYVAVDESSGVVMFGGERNGLGKSVGYMARYIASSASVVKTERNSAVASLKNNPRRGTFITGDKAGTGYEIDSNIASRQIFFQSGKLMYGVGYDALNDVVFWGTQDTNSSSSIIRLNSYWQSFGQTGMFVNKKLMFAYFDLDNNAMYWYTKSGSGDVVYKYQITSCDLYDCLTCQSDQNYCGFCSSSRACSISQACTANDWDVDIRNYICPVIQKITPSRGSIDGNTVVTVTSTFADNSGNLLNDVDLRCVWDDSTTTTVYNLQYQSLQCTSPATATASTKNLRIRWKNTWWTTNAASFTYYQCSASSDCASCFTETECGLCLTNSTCGSVQRCDSNSWTRSCPAVTSLSSLGASIRGNKLITLTISPTVVPNANYTCVFDGQFETQATRVSSTSISCRTPDIRPQWDTLRDGQAEIRTTIDVRANGKLYTSTSGFIFYDCDLYAQDCSTCTDAFTTVAVRDDCTFCFNTRVCMYVANATASCTTSGRCPSINDIVPSSIYVGDLATTTIRISGLFVFDGQTLPTLKCAWNVGTAATLAQLTDATPTNNTYISCPSMTGLAVGDHKVSVWADIGGGNYQRLTPDSTIAVYDCSATSCSDCASDSRPTCSWCGTNLQCFHEGSATCAAQATSSNSSTCPTIISATPSSASTLGDELVVFTGSFSFSQVTGLSQVSCVFGNTSVTATNWTDATVSCITTIAPVGVIQAYILVNGVAYTNLVSFTFYDCGAITTGCSDCLAPLNTRCKWCSRYCAFNCDSTDFQQIQCPLLTSVTPYYGYFEGGETIVINGGPFFSRPDFTYTCLFDDQPADSTAVSSTDSSNLICVTPSRRRLIGDVQLRVLLNGDDIAPNTPLNFTFFSCNSFSTGSGCQAQCMSDSPYCGWCLTTKTCGPQTRCTGSEEFFLTQCIDMTVSPNYATLFGNDTLTIDVIPSIDPFVALASVASNMTKRSVTDSFFCEFEGVPKVSATLVNSSSLMCTPPKVIFESSLNFRLLFEGTPIAGPVPFTFVECSQLTSCSQCIAKNFCGWCAESNTCTTQATCGNQDLWGSNCSGAVDVAGLVAGVVVGGVALIAGTIVLILFLRWRKRRGGLIVEVVEPDYLQVAYQTDLSLKYKINAKDDYQHLEDVLMSRDRTFVDAVAEVTAPTEQDAVAKYLIFLAQNKQQGAEMLQYFVSEEARKASSENTIFRQNSIGSKMFKYYSKLVGTKYLWFTLARVVNELNTVAAKAMKEADRMDSDDKGASLLQIEMEVDPNKIKDASVDTDQNVYQLALACQKIFTVIKNGDDKVPNEFRQIFARMSYTIMDKFGNEDAVFKAIGGLLFLRYIGPALTAPHYYGLLLEAPNQVAQRQLVLIAKVLQTLANMATNNKEAYMENLSDFINRNKLKVAEFYRSILNTQERAQAKVKMDLELPSEVRLNSLAYLHEHIVRNENKIRERFTQIEDEEKSAQMIHMLNAILDMYNELPKKKEQGGKDKDKKKETLDV
eukprot:TRINITY_DN413_c0_g1_i2.p1 TRINITY_DN413_c0_g1~~TRINITY_DN413_c0_g1_i2.p1  ORF type:complete len:1681 (-),score=270.20 TRINITY_DN413_c0_g1_i2:53-5059(-)